MPGDDDSLDLIAAALRADAGDLDAFVEGLAAKLELTIPGKVKITRRRDSMLGPKRVCQIALDAGGERLELVKNGTLVETRRARLSGGIVLKTEPLPTDAWIEALGEALKAEAQRSDTTRQALERLLTG